MQAKKKRRPYAEVNAGSMADIAFLLLIFFLVTTTIENDKGILVKLPPFSDEPIIPEAINQDNVFTVKLNGDNQLFVENEILEVSELRDKTKYHIMNPDKLESLPDKPSLSVISLQNDRGTDYETYLSIYNELKAAYNELWEETATNLHGKPFAELSKTERNEIKTSIPQVISEAEPTDFGEKS